MMEERDARGWVLTLCSGLACCAGASIVFIDLLPWRHFSIRSNSSFLAACLSLSFSVLSFSSARLFGEAVAYLERGSRTNPYYIVMVSFSAGFLICYYLFKFLHRFIPHRTVHCDDEDSEDDDGDKLRPNGYGSGSSGATLAEQGHSNGRITSLKATTPDEETALLSNGNGLDHRPTLAKRLSDITGKITRRCTGDGRCRGFVTCPCKGNCLHNKNSSTSTLHSCQPNHCARTYPGGHPSHCTDECSSNTNISGRQLRDTPILEDEELDHDHLSHRSHSHHRTDSEYDHDELSHAGTHSDENGHSHKHSHHHHIANNAFVGIGFQTTLAIALSAWKAVLITFLVGGLAQPLGALIAFIWLKVGSAPSETAYGIIFSFTGKL
ncbi:hypothetical protein ABW21_db0203165 [Orbilia brochopaga]|nr:hypothetical protein ABW21_db0203165 [Drechslerella brochopaga]